MAAVSKMTCISILIRFIRFILRCQSNSIRKAFILVTFRLLTSIKMAFLQIFINRGHHQHHQEKIRKVFNWNIEYPDV